MRPATGARRRSSVRFLIDGRRHVYRMVEAALAAARRPAAERAALRRRRASLLSGMEQSLVAGLDELRQFHLDSAQMSAAAENRFRFAVARRNDAATAMTALPFPKWAA